MELDIFVRLLFKMPVQYAVIKTQHGIRVKSRRPSMFKANLKVAAGIFFCSWGEFNMGDMET